MSWMNALLWWQWLVLAVVPPLIVLLYFLKLRRQPLVVPSTFLWTKTIEDMHVNSLWQRLRQNLLLFLQLLLVLLLMLACLRPGCQGVELQGDRFVFLIDQSASMSARDLGDRTRLEEAKLQVQQTIKRMKPRDVAMLISFSDRAEVVQSFTSDQNLLQRKLADVKQTQYKSDISEALLAASGLANPGRTATEASDVQVADSLPATLMIYSDGAVLLAQEILLGNLTPQYFPIGSPETPNNVGIVAFAIDDEGVADGKLEAYAQLQNSIDMDRQVQLSLTVDGNLLDAKTSPLLKAGATAGLSFDLSRLLGNITQPQRIKLSIEESDCYTLDNSVEIVLNPPRPRNVLVVTPGNDYLQLALQTEQIARIAKVEVRGRDFLSTPEYSERSNLGGYDLVIFDQCQPAVMPQCNTVFLGSIPNDPTWAWGEPVFPTAIIDFDRSHPVMFGVQLTQVMIIEGRPLTGPKGVQSLLEATYGSIMAIAPRSGFEDLVISFPLMSADEQGNPTINSNWPSQLSFPLFVSNVIQVLGGGSRLLAAQNVSPGEVTRLPMPQTVMQVQLKPPQGNRLLIQRTPSNEFVFSQTDQVGVYEARPSDADDALPVLFAVNLMDPRESDLLVREQLKLGDEQVAGDRSVQPARQEYWKWLVMAGLVVLVVEWLIYNRRVLL